MLESIDFRSWKNCSLIRKFRRSWNVWIEHYLPNSNGRVSEVSFRGQFQRSVSASHLCNLFWAFQSCLSHLKNHEVVHSEERPFKCEICDKGFRRKYDKNRHVALVHIQKIDKSPDQTHSQQPEYSIPPSQVERLSANQQPALGIQSEFSLQTYLNQIIQSTAKQEPIDDDHDANQMEPESSITSAASSTSSSSPPKISFKVEISRDDDGHVMDTDIPQTHKIEKQFYCSQCPKSFPYLSHLRKHQVIHFDEKPFNCDICNKSFRRWDYFYRVHEIKMFLDKMFLSDTRKLYITLKTIN